MEKEKETIKQALLKKALGYDKQEIHEEYARSEDGEMQLVKRKVTDRHHAPDPVAAKMLIGDEPVTNRFVLMTLQELTDEKERLKKELLK